MRFRSILFDGPDETQLVREQPPFFADLNLDQVLASLTAGREEYELEPFFWTPLHDVAAVEYRHAAQRDLARPEVLASVRAFAEQMQSMRERLAQEQKLHYDLQRQRWFLDAVRIYCAAVERLRTELGEQELSSSAFRGLRDHLCAYVSSDAFTSLAARARELDEGLAAIRYTVDIRGNRIRVDRYRDEADYGADVQATFARFQQGAARDHPIRLPGWPEMNHVEAQVAQLVAQLHPDVFEPLKEFRSARAEYLEPTIRDFDREVQLYLAYRDYAERLKARGLTFCYPRLSVESKEEDVAETFDVALATKLAGEGATVVVNDLSLTGPERTIVVTGPNQGGKTTFARAFGQLHHLASVGLPVPGRDARLFLPDRIFTHFEREEDLATLHGKLEDELVRMRGILEHATSRSLLVMNESFTSTTLQDALFIGAGVLEQLHELDLLCVYVTFVDELASLNETVVSMASTVVPDDPATRTFRIVRKPADGLAYAAAIAEKYGLTYRRLRQRVPR